MQTLSLMVLVNILVSIPYKAGICKTIIDNNIFAYHDMT